LERNEDGEEYFTHPYSELKFPVSYKQFGDGNFIPVPQYLRETDVPGNSISREPNKSNPMAWYFSELTYNPKMNVNMSYTNEQFKFQEFWDTRRGKRREKYHYYMEKRLQKRRLYDQMRAKEVNKY
jgi:hypothetical protein